MDVWIRWARRKAICKWCSEVITAGTPEVITKYWRPGKWSILTRYHAECWLKQGLDYLDKHPHISKRLAITDDQSKARLLLLRRWATCKCRLKKAIIVSNHKAIERLVSSMHTIVEEIDKVGGVPATWVTMAEKSE